MHNFIPFFLLFSWIRLGCTQSTVSTLPISEDGNCGLNSGQTCLTSSFGDCCSGRGFCGSTNDYCNPTGGCQTAYGSCATNTSSISADGRCGSTDPNSQICIGSSFGSCCSEKGWCGDTSDYCGTGCESAFGTCGLNSTVNSSTSASTSSVASASSSTLVGSSSSAIASSSSNSTSSTSTASSNSSSATPTASGTSAATLDSAETSSNKSTVKIAVGVVVGVLALVGIAVAAFFLLRRRKRSSKESLTEDTATEATSPDEKVEVQQETYYPNEKKSVFEVPDTPLDGTITSSTNSFRHVNQQPVELGSPGYGRAELGPTYVEMGDHR